MKKSIALFAVVASLCTPLVSQTAVVLAPVPQLQFFDQSGRPLAFGCVFTYQVNSTTPLATYTDYTGITQNQNPVILSGGGSANIWLQAGQGYSFRVLSAGGTNCASGSTLYTVNGIGGGSTTITTVVPYSANPVFPVSAQNQLFEITLTGNASAQPLTFVGVTPPSVIFFQISQDAAGSRTFSWPANSVGGCTIGSASNSTTTQEFVYNGTNATAIGPCVIGNGPAIDAGPITATSLNVSGAITFSGFTLLNGFFGCTEGTALSGLAGQDNMWCDSTAHRWSMTNNNSAADQVLGAATTDTLTNKTFDTSGTGNVLKINGTQVTAKTGTGATVALNANPTLVGWNCAITTKSANYTLLTSDCIIQASANAGNVTLTLPHAATGNFWLITRTDSATHTLTLAGDSGNVNGVASINVPINTTYYCHADGTNSWCQLAPPNNQLAQTTVLTSSATTFTYPIPYSSTPVCVCSGVGGSCNVSTVSTSACVLNITASSNQVIVVGTP